MSERASRSKAKQQAKVNDEESDDVDEKVGESDEGGAKPRRVSIFEAFLSPTL